MDRPRARRSLVARRRMEVGVASARQSLASRDHSAGSQPNWRADSSAITLNAPYGGR